MKEFQIKKFVQSVWQFCRYLFWPRWGQREANSKLGHTDPIDVLCHTESTEITERVAALRSTLSPFQTYP